MSHEFAELSGFEVAAGSPGARALVSADMATVGAGRFDSAQIGEHGSHVSGLFHSGSRDSGMVLA